MSPSFSKSQQQVVKKVAQRSSELKQLSDGQLRDVLDDIRAKVFDKRSSQADLTSDVLSIAKEACRRVLGIELYDVQLLAADALSKNQIAEMQTGEGKTIAAVPAAVLGGVLGRGVHVATPNSYLAERDYSQLRDVYESLGLSVGLLESDSEAKDAKIDAYACDITYGPGYEFGFDYLRDQLQLKAREALPAGRTLIQSLQGKESAVLSQVRGLGLSIVDEADHVLLDDATSPQVLSEFQPGEAPDRDAVVLAGQLAMQLQKDTHYREFAPEQLDLTQEGVELVHRPDVAIPVDQLIRPWAKYVEAALRARHLFERNVNYIVHDGEVRIVDASTGRIFEDRSWQAGIHQAVEAKEGVAITPESVPLAQITRQRFYRLYGGLAGMTGTAHHCQPEFKSVYGLGVVKIPLRVASQRQGFPFRAFANQERKWAEILLSVREMHQLGRPVLIGTRSISESLVIAGLLKDAGLSFVLLNGQQDAEEAYVVSQAGCRGAITIATNLAGRGTDIKLEASSKEAGGLHVIVSECQASFRVDRQLIGRCGRQGDPGSCQTFVSADDWLLQTHAPWLADTIRQMAKNGEMDIDIEPKIRQVQRQLGRQAYASRLVLLQQNERENKILSSHWN